MKNKLEGYSVGYVIETIFPSIKVDDRGGVILLSLPNLDHFDFECHISRELWESTYTGQKHKGGK